MTEQKQMQFPSAWDNLPKAEQEKVKKHLKSLPEKEAAKPSKNGKASFNLRGYIRCELSSADKDAFKAWESSDDVINVIGRLIDIVESGYLLKVGDTGSNFQASLCAATTNKPWEGFVLTAHASYAKRAVYLLWYKHVMMMEGDWSAWLTEDGDDLLR